MREAALKSTERQPKANAIHNAGQLKGVNHALQPSLSFTDNRHESIAQMKLQQSANRYAQQSAIQTKAAIQREVSDDQIPLIQQMTWLETVHRIQRLLPGETAVGVATIWAEDHVAPNVQIDTVQAILSDAGLRPANAEQIEESFSEDAFHAGGTAYNILDPTEGDADRHRAVLRAVILSSGLHQSRRDIALQRYDVASAGGFAAYTAHQRAVAAVRFAMAAKDPIALKKVGQLRRASNANSGPKNYTSTSGVVLNQVGYTTDGVGNINFSAPWRNAPGTPYGGFNPVTGPVVNLAQGSGSAHYMNINDRSGKPVPIKGSRRDQHFRAANLILGNGLGGVSPAGYTWHHLTAFGRMVRVDRMVHRKHGHNGGFLLW